MKKAVPAQKATKRRSAVEAIPAVTKQEERKIRIGGKNGISKKEKKTPAEILWQRHTRVCRRFGGNRANQICVHTCEWLSFAKCLDTHNIKCLKKFGVCT